MVTDLVFNLQHSDHWPTRTVMKLNEWDIERIIMGHGDIVTHGGTPVLRKAFHWLPPARG